VVRGVLNGVLCPFCKRLKVQSRLRSGSRGYKRRDCEGDSSFGVVALFAVMLRLGSPLRLRVEITVEIKH
jgi:hypothetical protein